MKELNDIEKIVRDKLQNFEAPVRNGLWANIQSGISAPGAAAASSNVAAIILKTVAAISVIGIGTYFVVKNLDSSKEKTPTTVSAVQPNSTTLNEQSLNQDKNEGTTEPNKSKVNSTSSEPTYTPVESVKKTLPKTEIVTSSSNKERVLVEQTQNKTELNNNSAEPTSLKSYESATSTDKNAENKVDKIISTAEQNKKSPAVIETTQTETTSSTNGEQRASEENTFMKNLPNVITPNGDGSNDILIFKTPPLRKFVMEVYNNRGELVFKSIDQNIGWSGQDLSGNPVADGSYFYKITAEGEDGVVYGTNTQTILVTR